MLELVALVVVLFVLFSAFMVYQRNAELKAIWAVLLDDAYGDQVLRLKAYDECVRRYGPNFTMEEARAVLSEIQITGR